MSNFMTKPTTKPRQKEDIDIDIDIDNDIDIDKEINIMYKYIIFFGVMSKNIIREAKTLCGWGLRRKQGIELGRSLRRWELVSKEWNDALNLGNYPQ